jgi:multidrug efflux pump subunit AcrB
MMIMIYEESGNELANEIKKINDVGDINVIGGRKRKINVMLDRNKMASYNVDPLMMMMQLKGSNKQSMSGQFQLQIMKSS